MTTYPQYFTNNGVGCVSVDGLVRCGLGELGIDLVKNPDSLAESFTLRTTDMTLEYNFNSATSTTSLADIATIGNRLSSVVSPPDVKTLQIEDAIQIQGSSNSIILSSSAGVNQLLINDNTGENGMVLASGGSEGGIYWTTSGGGGSQTLAETLALGNVGDDNQSIYLSRGVDEAHPYGIQVVLNGGGGLLTSKYYLTAENTHLIETSLTPNQVFLINEDDTNPAVKNTLESRLYADEFIMSSQTGDPAVIQYDTMTLTTASLTFNAQLGEADPIGLSLDSAKIGLISGGNTDYGTAGQVLTSGGEAGTLSWADGAGTTPSLADVLAVSPAGQASNNQEILLTTDSSPAGAGTMLLAPYGISQVFGTDVEGVVNGYKTAMGLNGIKVGTYDNQITPVINPVYETSIQSAGVYLNANTGDPVESSYVGLEMWNVGDAREGFQIDINGSYGEAGYVLTSGGTSGISWSPAGESQNLASVLAVSPAGEANEGQIITLSKDTETFLGSGTNIVSGVGIAMDFQGIEIASNLRFVNEVAPNFTHIKTFDSSVFPPIDNQPEYETFVESGYISITQTANVEDVATTDYLVLEPTRIGIAVANGAEDYGTAGQVLTSGGEAGTLTWAGVSQTLQATLNLGNVANNLGSNVGTITLSSPPIEIGEPIPQMTIGGEQVVFSKTELGYDITSTLNRSSLLVKSENSIDANQFQEGILSKDVIATSYNFGVKTAGGVNLSSVGGSLDESTLFGEGSISISHTESVANTKTKECSMTMEYDKDASSWGFTTLDAVAETTIPLLLKQNVSLSENQTLTLPQTGTIFGDGTNVISGSGSILDFTGTGIATNRRYTNTSSIDGINIAYYDSTIFPPEIPVASVSASFLNTTPVLFVGQSQNVDLVQTSQSISIEPTRIGIGSELGQNYGTAGQVLTSGGEAGNVSWTTPSGTPSLAEVLDVAPAGVANLGQSITIPAEDIEQYLGINLTMEGGAVIVSANETSTPDEITDQTQLTFQGFSTFRTDTISDPKTQVLNEMTPAYTIIKDISGDLETTATQLTNTMSASSILLQNDSVVAFEPTTNSSVEMTNSALTLTSNSEDPVITSTNVISPTTIVITNGNIPQTTTFSATGMGTGSTTQPLNINAPFTLVSPVIDTPDLPLCYTPYAGYGDALVVYNNVGVVPEVSNGYAEVIFQNISATSQSSNITAICESDGDYMTMGQVSQTGTALYDTLFEIQGAGYMSSTGHQILGANSAGSADKSVVIAYGNGTGGFQVSPSGAIGFDATPNVVGDVVSLQDGDFGTAGQFLVSQGDTLPPLWNSPSTQQIVSTSGNVSSTLNINSVIGVLIITPTAGTASGRTFFLPNPPPPVGYFLSVNNLSGVAWVFTTTQTNGYLLIGANRTASLSVGINSSGVLRYLGNIDFSGTIRPCWSF